MSPWGVCPSTAPGTARSPQVGCVGDRDEPTGYLPRHSPGAACPAPAVAAGAVGHRCCSRQPQRCSAGWGEARGVLSPVPEVAPQAPTGTPPGPVTRSRQLSLLLPRAAAGRAPGLPVGLPTLQAGCPRRAGRAVGPVTHGHSLSTALSLGDGMATADAPGWAPRLALPAARRPHPAAPSPPTSTHPMHPTNEHPSRPCPLPMAGSSPSSPRFPPKTPGIAAEPMTAGAALSLVLRRVWWQEGTPRGVRGNATAPPQHPPCPRHGDPTGPGWRMPGLAPPERAGICPCSTQRPMAGAQPTPTLPR